MFLYLHGLIKKLLAFMFRFTNLKYVFYLVRVMVICLTPLSTIFQLYHGRQFYCWRKLEYPEETGVPRGNWSTQRKLEYPEETGVPRENPDLPQVTDKLYHIKLY
jgi:hypothetical protein